MLGLADISALRIFLFSGLVIHKLVWEALKRSAGARKHEKRNSTNPVTTLVKGIKLLVLLFLLAQTLFLDVLPLSENPFLLKTSGTVLYLAGLATALMGRIHLGRNWADLEDYGLVKGQSLVSYGIYRYIRHPIYIGDVLLLAGLELALNSWLVLMVPAVFLIVLRQASREEALLSKSLPGYDRYCADTKRFIPYLY